jgi:hypothetical protein
MRADRQNYYYLMHPASITRESAPPMFSALQARAGALGITLRTPPSEPDTCCGRGCNGCVWEGYLAAAGFWRDDALLAIGQNTVPGIA